MDDFLGALLTKESMPADAGICRYCNKGRHAIWRCRDCLISTPQCRNCMRTSHRSNPLHRIQQWNGKYFRPADLWEVGSYLLVQHHIGDPICNTLQRWCDMLESAEEIKDETEQDLLSQHRQVPVPMPVPDIQSRPETDPYDMEPCQGSIDEDDEDNNDDMFEEEDDLEVEGNPYLTTSMADANAGPGPSDNVGGIAGVDPNLASVTLRSYIRVVHTNGLHNIAMVSCQCHGEDVFPLDLFAAQLLPASLKKIKTLFTAQLLDSFRLCNLELKASAYQFYQLLRRLTQPMAPAEVPNLYREFRRMSRIWRWMKKLKWAGYASVNNPVADVKPGELAIYCPACPQAGINIPDNWKDDPARYEIIFPRVIELNIFNRWVYKRIFVADGNFKADHVRQKDEVGDVWLSEGSGMIPSRHEYLSFLAKAIERLTVSRFCNYECPGKCRCRKHLQDSLLASLCHCRCPEPALMANKDCNTDFISLSESSL
jgi:CxC2 like cysteine cluster associated with KDZ transposases